MSGTTAPASCRELDPEAVDAAARLAYDRRRDPEGPAGADGDGDREVARLLRKHDRARGRRGRRCDLARTGWRAVGGSPQPQRTEHRDYRDDSGEEQEEAITHATMLHGLRRPARPEPPGPARRTT